MPNITNKLGEPDLSTIITLGQKAVVKSWPTYLGGELDRTQYATASEIGSCMRQAAFNKRGKQVPFDEWGYAERGHAVEAWVADRFRRAEIEVDNSRVLEFDLLGDEQVSFIHNYQSGTPDGLVHLGPKTWVLDIKSVDPRSNWSYFPKSKHVDQVLQNIDLIRNNSQLNVVGGIIFYIDASDFQKSKQYSVPINEQRIEELRARAERIVTAAHPSHLPAEGMYNDGCGYCAFTALCSEYMNKAAADDDKLRDAERVLGNVFRQS